MFPNPFPILLIIMYLDYVCITLTNAQQTQINPLLVKFNPQRCNGKQSLKQDKAKVQKQTKHK